MRVYTTEVIVEDQEFAESRAESEANRSSFQSSPAPGPAPSIDAGDGEDWNELLFASLSALLSANS